MILPTQKKFPHWEVLQKAYERQIVIAQDKIEWQQLDKTLKDLQMFSGGSGYDALYLKASNAFVLKNKELVKATISEMEEFKSIVGDAEVLYGKFVKKTSSTAIAELDDLIESAFEQGNISEAKKAVSELKEWAMIDDAWGAASKVFDETDSKLSKMLKAAYSDALESGNMVQAKSALQEAGKWQELIPTFKEAAAFKSKSAEYNKLVAELGDAIDAGDADLAKKKAEAVAQKRVMLDKKYGNKRGGNVFSESYEQSRKDAAVWDTAEEAVKNNRFHGNIADGHLRPQAEKIWSEELAKDQRVKELIRKYENGEISKTEFNASIKNEGLIVKEYKSGARVEYITGREGIQEYTWHYCDVNEPLQLRNNYDSAGYDRFIAKSEAITDYIERCDLPTDMWLQRGDDALAVIRSRIEFAGGTMPAGWERDVSKLEGMVMQEGGFMSTGSRKTSGFQKRVTINIFAPKGTKGAYVEPFSNYGAIYDADGLENKRSFGKYWDGKTKPRVSAERRKELLRRQAECLKNGLKFDDNIYSTEFETLLQRGTKMKIIRAYESGGYYYFDVEIIGQELKDLSYVSRSLIH